MPGEILVREAALLQGAALSTGDGAQKACDGAGESSAGQTLSRTDAQQDRSAAGGKRRKAGPSVIKNAETADDILATMGRFAVVERWVLSVRQARATVYLNFGRSWTRGITVTISRRAWPAIEAAGILSKSREDRRVRVCGSLEAHGSLRIVVLLAGQIALLGGN